MRKRVAGCALIAATSILAFHPIGTQNKEDTGNEQIIQNEARIGDSIVEEAGSGVPVTWVATIDGDTIKVRVEGNIETVRYLLIDTPESKKPGMCVQPFAMEAFQRNEELVRAGEITLEVEKGNDRDSYGRLLAYVFVNGNSVQETLLKEGLARVAYIIHPPYRYLERYLEDENLAKIEKRNIWGKANYVTQWGFSGCGSEF
ncbi:thermonuclease family protein [Neobacillus drentensis]|uniref:thermonuclease family protein n=1 Tax=Neobacillus drentensis TaxID=220684 RepID=UPI0023D90449|nr:thermonuclease family protein [Neobacillus drentensis]